MNTSVGQTKAACWHSGRSTKVFARVSFDDLLLDVPDDERLRRFERFRIDFCFGDCSIDVYSKKIFS